MVQEDILNIHNPQPKDRILYSLFTLVERKSWRDVSKVKCAYHSCRTGVQFPASQLLLTIARRSDALLFWSLEVPALMCTNAHIYIILKIKNHIYKELVKRSAR